MKRQSLGLFSMVAAGTATIAALAAVTGVLGIRRLGTERTRAEQIGHATDVTREVGSIDSEVTEYRRLVLRHAVASDPADTATVESQLSEQEKKVTGLYESVLKEDLLRTGIAFDDTALSDNLDGEVKPKSYFIFSFDQKPLAELGEAARRRPPEELALKGGPYGLRRTIVSVRVDPASPYRVEGGEEGLGLRLEGRPVADVGLPPMPEYYRHRLKNGKTVMETAPTI